MIEAYRTATNFPDAHPYINQDAHDLASVRGCLDGDSASFAPIVERYHRVLYTVALRMLGNRADAEDATQAAFIKSYEKLRTFDPTRRFFSWLYRILLNQCHDVRRDRRPMEGVTPDMAVQSGPADQFDLEERRRRVQAAIVKLPAAYREVVVLRHFTELSYDQIAEVLQVRPSVVKSRLYTARQLLSEALFDEVAR
jgi:RNA polymerase sigma-70 factor, ECF subfamily